MNKARRTELANIREGLEMYKGRLEAVMDEEQNAFDNLSEGLQATMRGSMMEEAIDNMSSAIDSIEEAIDYIDEASA